MSMDQAQYNIEYRVQSIESYLVPQIIYISILSLGLCFSHCQELLQMYMLFFNQLQFFSSFLIFLLVSFLNVFLKEEQFALEFQLSDFELLLSFFSLLDSIGKFIGSFLCFEHLSDSKGDSIAIECLVGSESHLVLIPDSHEHDSLFGTIDGDLSDDLIECLTKQLFTNGANALSESLTMLQGLLQGILEPGDILSFCLLMRDILHEAFAFVVGPVARRHHVIEHIFGRGALVESLLIRFGLLVLFYVVTDLDLSLVFYQRERHLLLLLLCHSGSCILFISHTAHTINRIYCNIYYKIMKRTTSFVHVNPTSSAFTSLYPANTVSSSQTTHKKNLLQSLSSHFRSRSTFTLKEGFQVKLQRSERIKDSFVTSSRRPKKSIQVNEDDLLQTHNRSMPKKNIYGIIYVKQYGIRIKMKHCFVTSSQIYDVRQIDMQIRTKIKQLTQQTKKLYLFHIDGKPLLSTSYHEKQRVFLVNIHPNICLSFKMKQKLLDAARQVQQKILQHPNVIPKEQQVIDEQGSEIYDWRKIKSVQQYVNGLWSNPQCEREVQKEAPTQFMRWCGEPFKEMQQKKPNDRNPLFEASCHYSQQTSDIQNLHEASTRLGMLSTTQNLHKIKTLPLDNLIEKVRRESVVGLEEDERVKKIPSSSKREMWRVLENKHALLSQQNIPYLIEKYGITRYEIYKLFNLYKGLEKVSCMREQEGFDKVLEKGIGRGTFDESLKHLDMHPGDQLVKGVTFFPDFIRWEDFLKIVSISLRKTPQEKLQALLQGISAGALYLTSFQIGVMVGSSLAKLFGSEQPDLKTYFTKVAMIELDPQNSASVSIAGLKNKVLNKGSKKMDIVSFLILNS